MQKCFRGLSTYEKDRGNRLGLIGQSSPFWVEMGWIGCDIWQATLKRLLRSFPYFQLNYFKLKLSRKKTFAHKFSRLISDGTGGVS